MLVLGVQFQQRCAQLAHFGHRNRTPVNLRTAFAGSVNHTAQNHLIGVGLGLRRQPGARRSIGRQVELRRDVRLLLSYTHVRAIGSCSKRQPKRVKHNGFTRPRFARECDHARLKLDIQTINEHKVTNRELLQHIRKSPLTASSVPNPQASRSSPVFRAAYGSSHSRVDATVAPSRQHA